jgi:outer membrane protein assembly factor BamB
VSATVVAARSLAAVGLGGLLVVTMSLDLAPLPALDAEVRLDEAPSVADNPLSSDEAERLRAQADHDQLRCEPRGCELWRIELPRGQDVGGGAVLLDNGLLVMNGGRIRDFSLFEGTVDEDGDEGVTVVAVDPTTGDEAWAVPIRDPAPYSWVMVMPGHNGLLAQTATTVTSIAPDGERRWQWQVPDGGEWGGEVWGTHELDGVVLISGHRSARIHDPVDEAVIDDHVVTETDDSVADPEEEVDPEVEAEDDVVGDLDGEIDDEFDHLDGSFDQFLVAVDARTGAQLWSRPIRQQAGGESDALLVIGADGHLQRLAPSTGEVLWTGAEVADGWVMVMGRWALVQEDRGEQQLFDIETGGTIGGFDGWLVSSPWPVGDGLVAAVHTTSTEPPWDGGDESATLELVHLGPDGDVVWTAELGIQDPWYGCCSFRYDAEADTVLAIGPNDTREFHLATGRPIRIEPHDDADPRGRVMTWQLDPETWLHWSDDGRRYTIETQDGEVTVRSRHHLQIVSADPIVVADEDHLIGVRIPDTD